MESKPGTQSSFHKLNFDNSSQKVCYIKHQSFIDLFNFTRFLNFFVKYFAWDCKYLPNNPISAVNIISDFLQLLYQKKKKRSSH